jgi:hypothetical protein
MNILNVPVIIALGGALIVVGCDRDPPRPETASVAATGSTAAPKPPPPVDDPSLPEAGPALQQQAASAPTANHGANQPMKPMTKAEESSQMPKATQANDHSSIAKDPPPSKP